MATLLRPEQIRTASLYPLATLEALTAGTGRVLVTRYWPRGLKRGRVDEWLAGMSPSATLLRAYQRKQLTWEQFADAYRLECTQPKRMRDALYALRDGLLRDYGAITLLCHEHDAPEDTVRCHRRLLRELLLEIEAH